MTEKYHHNYIQWAIALGLQKVDGLNPSQKMLEEAQKNLSGEKTLEEVKYEVHEYYNNKKERNADEEEADKTAINIKKTLEQTDFELTPETYLNIHKDIFEGVFDFAGNIRNCDLTKREWVLNGDTVIYLPANEIKEALNYDFNKERKIKYPDMKISEAINHFSKFISGLWQIHPFREGNTRTNAVFAIKYLNQLGFIITNDMFALNSWYYRNALVRANYSNSSIKINSTTKYLEKFFINLLSDNNEIQFQNRELLVNANFEEEPIKTKIDLNKSVIETQILIYKERYPKLSSEDIAIYLNTTTKKVNDILIKNNKLAKTNKTKPKL